MAQHEDRFRIAVENAVVGFLIEDPRTGRVLEVNRAACTILRRTEEDLLGRTWQEITHPEDRQDGLCILAKLARADADVVSMRKRYLSPDGSALWASVSVTTVRDRDGQPRFNIVQVRDSSTETNLADLVRLVCDMPDPQTLTEKLYKGMYRHLGATAMALYATCDVNKEVRLVGSTGWNEAVARQFALFPLHSNGPVPVAACSGRPVMMNLRDIPDILPLSRAWVENHPHGEIGTMASFPVRFKGTPAGVLYLETSGPVDWTWQLVASLESVSNAIAPWMVMHHSEMDCTRSVGPSRSSVEVSDRQRTIVRLVDGGKSNQEIADELGYSEATVRADLVHLSRMLGAHGRRDVVRRFSAAGL